MGFAKVGIESGWPFIRFQLAMLHIILLDAWNPTKLSAVSSSEVVVTLERNLLRLRSIIVTKINIKKVLKQDNKNTCKKM